MLPVSVRMSGGGEGIVAHELLIRMVTGSRKPLSWRG